MTRVTLTGGLVVDGSGAEPIRADVLIDGDEIRAVGPSLEPIGDEIDVSGHVIAPGFIDTHVHALPLLGPNADDVESALLCQGITSVILGADGVGPCPGGRPAARYADTYFDGIDGPVPERLENLRRVSDLLAACDGASRLNIGYLIPAGTVRRIVMHDVPGPADDTAVRAMSRLVAEGMEDGALGAGTGLEYVPGAWARADELARVLRPVGDAGGVHASHVRGYESGIGAAIEELAAIGEGSGARSHVAHLRAPAEAAIRALDLAESRGQTITFDSYPFASGMTLLAMKAIPEALQHPDPQAALKALYSATVGADLEAEWLRRESELGGYRLAHAGSDEWRHAEGSTISELSELTGRSIPSLVALLLQDSRLGATCVVPSAGESGEDDVARLMLDDRHMGSSDGIFVGSLPHPRGWSAFARALEWQLGRGGGWTWGQAAWHLSGHAAARFGVHRRGRVARGFVADIAVLDASALAATSTFAAPRSAAKGVSRVFVAGTEVMRDGQLVGTRTGRGLRRHHG